MSSFLIGIFLIAQIGLFVFLGSVILSYLRHQKKEMPLLSSLGCQNIKEKVLIIVPAKDEEENIGACLEHLSQLQHLENFKVVAVNDRSDDKTLEKMQEVERKFPHSIETHSISQLPPGWLGKNHACWSGVQAGLQKNPDTEYLLFTDGDVKFHPDTVAESITWMKKEKIDFMTMIEDTEFEGILEPAYLSLFGIFLVFFSARPWLLKNPHGKNYMGNGAYLLMKREAYEKTSAHQTLRLEVVEDLRMGLLMRAYGFRCATAVGLDRMFRRWQPGFFAIFKGILKNSFAAFEYNLFFAFLGMFFFPFVFVGPLLCLFSPYPFVGIANISALLMISLLTRRISHLPWLTSFLLSPLMSMVASLNLATSTFLTLKNKGVSWRNTHYPLSELKAHCLTPRKAFAIRTNSSADVPA